MIFIMHSPLRDLVDKRNILEGMNRHQVNGQNTKARHRT
jgi:hypothetical protein